MLINSSSNPQAAGRVLQVSQAVGTAAAVLRANQKYLRISATWRGKMECNNRQLNQMARLNMVMAVSFFIINTQKHTLKTHSTHILITSGLKSIHTYLSKVIVNIFKNKYARYNF